MSETELLTADELVEITGRKHPQAQRAWLDSLGWTYTVNAAGRVIVGRWYARMKLAGITPSHSGLQPEAWQPDWSALTT